MDNNIIEVLLYIGAAILFVFFLRKVLGHSQKKNLINLSSLVEGELYSKDRNGILEGTWKGNKIRTSLSIFPHICFPSIVFFIIFFASRKHSFSLRIEPVHKSKFDIFKISLSRLISGRKFKPRFKIAGEGIEVAYSSGGETAVRDFLDYKRLVAVRYLFKKGFNLIEISQQNSESYIKAEISNRHRFLILWAFWETVKSFKKEVLAPAEMEKILDNMKKLSE